MKYNIDVFCKQFPIVKRFLYHLTCYRELHHTYNDLNLKCGFWSHTINAHLLQAAILWCMVFGSHGCNPTHWKKLCEQDSEELQDSFRKSLFKETGLSREKWDAYWSDMNYFRNGYAAHRELDYSKPVPNFNTAEMVACFYDGWIRKVIEPDVFEEPTLKESVIKMQKEIRPLVMHCLTETKLKISNTEQLS